MNILKLDSALSKKYGDYWELEPETIGHDLGVVFGPQEYAKVATLISLHNNPEEMLTYADYLLHFIEVANDMVPEEEYVHLPNTLELVWALYVLDNLIDDLESQTLHAVTGYILDHEGTGDAYHPILAKFSGRELVEDKRTKAADKYIEVMSK